MMNQDNYKWCFVNLGKQGQGYFKVKILEDGLRPIYFIRTHEPTFATGMSSVLFRPISCQCDIDNMPYHESILDVVDPKRVNQLENIIEDRRTKNLMRYDDRTQSLSGIPDVRMVTVKVTYQFAKEHNLIK